MATESVTVATDGASNAVMKKPEVQSGDDDPMVEVTGGHIYYLLDPVREVKGERSKKKGAGKGSHSQSNNCGMDSGRPSVPPPTQSKLRRRES